MDDNPGYLYTIEVKITSKSLGEVTVSDIYRKKVGLRQVDWDNSNFYINHKVTFAN